MFSEHSLLFVDVEHVQQAFLWADDSTQDCILPPVWNEVDVFSNVMREGGRGEWSEHWRGRKR